MIIVVHIFNPSTQEAETEGSLCIQSQAVLHSEFLDSQSYIVRPCLKEQRGRRKEMEEIEEIKEMEAWAGVG